MRRATPVLWAAAVATALSAGLVAAGEAERPSTEEGAAHFVEIAKVLQSPRCQNCHPAGDTPKHGDKGKLHAMNVSRKSPEAGLKCTTCHREKNQDEAGAPPGAPEWRMPGALSPMVFEGLTAAELCSRLKDPKHNGGRTPATLLDHMEHDKLVLWGWSPGPGRTAPPMTHAALVGHVKQWVAAGAPCPK